MKATTKKAAKKIAEPSADASPRHKKLVAAARGRGAPPAAPETAPPAFSTTREGERVNALDDFNDRKVAEEEARAKSAPTPQETPGPAHDAAAANDGTPPAWLPSDAAAPEAPFGRIDELGATWLRYLEANGARATTVAGYGRDLALAYRVLGEDAPPRLIDGDEIAKFEASDACTIKRNGKPRAKPSVDRTRRVLRLALTWAHAAGRIAANPYAQAVAS